MKTFYKQHLPLLSFMIAIIVVFLISGSVEKEHPKLIDVTSSKKKGERGIVEMYKWQFERLKNPKSNSVPVNMRQLELRYTRTMQEKMQLDKTSNLMANWFVEGPNNQGGRSKEIVEDIANPNTLLAAAAEGGVWRSENGGPWESVTDPSYIQNVNCLTQDTRQGKTNVWYYGTGEFLSNMWISGNGLGRFLGDGIYKSTDNGKTWNPLQSTISNSPAETVSHFQIVWDVEIDKTEMNIDKIYAACFGGIYYSNDGGENWNEGIVGSGGIWSVPQNTSVSINANGIAFAALSSGNNSGVYHSDGGENWTSITPNFWPAQVNRIETALSESNPDILYILANTPSVGTPGSNLDGLEGYTSLWRYDHSDGSWVNLSDRLPDFNDPVEGYSSQGGYDLYIKIKPDDENFVLIGGTNIYRTTDGFATKLNHDDWIGGYGKANDISLYDEHHPDQHGVFFSYTDSDLVYSAHDGGLSKTNDITASEVTWTSLNEGYVTTQFWHLAIEQTAAKEDVIVGGMQDNGTMFEDDPGYSTDWLNVGGGDGTYAAVADNNVYFYVSSQFANIYRTKTNGEWAQVTPEGASGFLFITPYMLDPNDTDVMFICAGDRVWRNSGLSAIQPYDQNPTSTNWSMLNGFVDGTRSTALAMSKSSPNVLIVGDNAGNVYKIADASDMNSPFSNISGNDFPNGYVASIDVNPHDVDDIIVGFSNYQTLSLFHTSDGGGSWSEIGGNLEENPDGSGHGPSIRNVKILPTQNGTVYLAATSVGLYSTSSLNGQSTTWVEESPDKIGNVIVETMAVRAADGKVVIGTFGKGVLSTNITLTDVEDRENVPNKFVLEQNYPNPFNPSTTIRFSVPQADTYSLRVFNALGEEVAILVNETLQAGTHEVNFNAGDLSSGVYFYKLSHGENVSTKKLILLK